jgi:membrane protease subunit HflK
MNPDNEHEHKHHHGDEHSHAPAPVTPEDAGSQALEEAMRSSFVIVKLAMVLMVIVFLGSGFFTVGPQEKAVILRFGKPVGEGQKALLTSGLHWSFPYPIDEIVHIPITEQQHLVSNIGWWFTTPEMEASGVDNFGGQALNSAQDGYVISGDQNIVHSRATLYYHIDDPLHYVFDFASASNSLQNALNNALLSTAGKYKVDTILFDKLAFQDAVRTRVSELTESENLGISIDECLVESKPPRQLASVFSAVTTARETRARQLDLANSYANRILSGSQAEAVTITNLASSDRDNYVKSIKADAKRFSDLLPQFQKYPGLFAQQQVVAALGQVLTNVQDTWFFHEPADGNSTELRLMLNRIPPEPKTGTNQ